MQITNVEELRKLYDQHGGDRDAVATALGISPEELSERVQPAPFNMTRRRQPPADLGHYYFRKYIVSYRHADHAVWPKDDEAAIEEARAKYEAGTHELCQQRDRNWFVLFCVPRVKRTGARKFFQVHD